MKVVRKRMTVQYHEFETGELWQDGYYDHVLRNEEATVAVARYILGNPVREGLVENATDYPFSWSLEW